MYFSHLLIIAKVYSKYLLLTRYSVPHFTGKPFPGPMMSQVCILFHLFFETGQEKLCLSTELGRQNKSLLIDNEHIGKNMGITELHARVWCMVNHWRGVVNHRTATKFLLKR